MGDRFSILTTPLAFAAYLVLVSGAIYHAYRWFRRAQKPGFFKLLQVFFSILLAMIFTAVAIDALMMWLSFMLLVFWPRTGSQDRAGLAMILIVAGWIVFLIVGAACSWIIGARVSRAFRDPIESSQK